MSNGDDCIDVLIPTCERSLALAITLTALALQDFPKLRVVISDQSAQMGLLDRPEFITLFRYLRYCGHQIETHHHLPRRGLAEQRQFLLSRARAAYCLFLDDDVLTEPDLLTRLHRTLTRERCGFVGSALHGLSYLDDSRPEQQAIEFWDAPVRPEHISPDSIAWQRHHLHSAANLLHVQQSIGLTPKKRQLERPYRIAWVGGCVLFDREKLCACGGFDFWPSLPPNHCGEDVLVQLRVMRRFGGCAILPSGAYHLELPTTVVRRDVDAPQVLRDWASE